MLNGLLVWLNEHVLCVPHAIFSFVCSLIKLYCGVFCVFRRHSDISDTFLDWIHIMTIQKIFSAEPRSVISTHTHACRHAHMKTSHRKKLYLLIYAWVMHSLIDMLCLCSTMTMNHSNCTHTHNIWAIYVNSPRTQKKSVQYRWTGEHHPVHAHTCHAHIYPESKQVNNAILPKKSRSGTNSKRPEVLTVQL